MIYYFSATGNSRHVATRIAEALGTQATEKTETNKLGKNPVWTAERCALCLGCLHRCPKFAISYNNKTQSHGQYQHSKYYKKG